MYNGCGGAGSWFKPPHSIFFEASCLKHDDNYFKGGNEADREKADLGLLYYMCQDVRKLSWFKQPYYYLWCLLYYFAVRLFGYKYFTYK